MNKIALGLVALLLSTTAYAQSNTGANMDAGASGKPNLMLRKQGGDGKADAGAKMQSDGKSEVTGSTRTSTSSESRQGVDDTNIRTRTSGSVGVESRERTGRVRPQPHHRARGAVRLGPPPLGHHGRGRRTVGGR